MECIKPIHKKELVVKCGNNRCMSVTTRFGRLFEKLLKQIVEEYGPFEIEEMGGFRVGRSCIENIFPITQIIEKKLETNKETTYLIDLTKAINNGTVTISYGK